MGIVPGAHRSYGSEDGQCDALSDAEESLECLVPMAVPVHAAPEAVDPFVAPLPGFYVSARRRGR